MMNIRPFSGGIAVLFLAFTLSAFAERVHPVEHKFYVSLLNMEYNAESKTFQLVFSVFTDDLQRALEKFSGRKTTIEQVSPANKALVFEYLMRHFSVKAGGAEIIFNNIGYELENDVTRIYIESEKMALPDGLQIRNDLLFEVYEDQKNLVKIEAGGENHSLLFIKGESVQILVL